MKVIFLDIDGVLNSNQWYYKRKELKQRDWTDKDEFDPDAVSVLNGLISDTNVKVVLSSTWRNNYDTLEEIQTFLKDMGIVCDCIGRTPTIRTTILGEHYGTAPRGVEIQDWIRTKGKDLDITNYVILDDDSDMLFNQARHFFRVDGYVGLTPNVAYRIERFLNNKF